MRTKKYGKCFTGIFLELFLIALFGFGCGYGFSLDRFNVAVDGNQTVHALIEGQQQSEGGPVGYFQYYLNVTSDLTESVVPGVFGKVFWVENTGMLIQLPGSPPYLGPGMVVFNDGKFEPIRYAPGLPADDDEADSYAWVLGNGQGWLTEDGTLLVMCSSVPGWNNWDQGDIWIVEVTDGKVTGKKILKPFEMSPWRADYRTNGGPVGLFLFPEASEDLIARRLLCEDDFCHWDENSLGHLVKGDFSITDDTMFITTNDGVAMLVNNDVLLWPGGKKSLSMPNKYRWTAAAMPKQGLVIASTRYNDDRILDIMLLDGAFAETKYEIPVDSSNPWNLFVLPIELSDKKERIYVFFSDGMCFHCFVIDPKKGLLESWKVELPKPT